MDNFWFIAYLSLAGLAVLQSVLLALQTWENRRFARSRLGCLDLAAQRGRVALILPCRGLDPGLADNLRRLMAQDYDNYEVVFVVESRSDPAYELIRLAMAEHPQIRSRLMVSGLAKNSGQKNHNLLMATAELGTDIEFLAFVDSDAKPRREWLRALIAALDQPGVGASTGYRWFVPTRPGLANYLLHSINSRIAVLFGSRRTPLLWGGSWAIRRELFESAGIREAWKCKLSDDLIAGSALRRKGLKVVFEPACVVTSRVEGSMRAMLSFLRRQYFLTRIYVPLWWGFALVMVTFSNTVLWGSLLCFTWGWVAQTTTVWVFAAVGLLLYLQGLFCGWIRQDLGRIYFPRLPDLERAGRFDIYAGPLVEFAHCLGLWGSVFGNRVTWRGITYYFRRGGRVEIAARKGKGHRVP